MNIAIIDKEKVNLETAEAFLRYYIKNFYSEHEAEISIEVFHCAKDFLQIFSPGLYHLVILGSDMEEVAEFIRANGDFTTKIIFLKLNDDYEMGGGIMNIAIVDDEKIELKAAESYLKNFIQEKWSELSFNIQTFSSAKEFLDNFKVGLFQLILLDIMMPEINGLQTAQIIRTRGDEDVNIVFLTANDDFILNGYRVFAVGYFIKPISDHADDFERTFEHIFPKILKKNLEIILTVENAKISVPLRNILYVDIDYRHRLCVYLADGKKFVTANNYSEIQPVLLADERFLECYHRIIVNMDYIKSMEPDDFILMDNTSIPISRRKKREVKVNFMRYFAHK